MLACRRTLLQHSLSQVCDLQAASDSPISKAFDKLKDEKAVSQAVRQGAWASWQKGPVLSYWVHSLWRLCRRSHATLGLAPA